jgi:class 3 adenylate cyclase
MALVKDPNGATYRGFLFADLRDYTSFVERYGDTAASALLDRYRALVRSIVAQYGGAEVKTEGDSFFVVFPSASSAVRCALEIQLTAAAATSDDPATPLRVGIGIHAGETVAGSEGYVGSAVNLAARVCAQARAGEVAVTDTVRSLTRTSLRVEFADRGRRRLKGIPEPVRLYLVSPGAGDRAVISGTAPSTSRRWAKRRYAVPVLTALLLGAGGVAAAQWLSARPPPEGAIATEQAATSGGALPPPGTPRPLYEGVLSTGTYATVEFQPPFSFSVGEGWRAFVDDADNFYMEHEPSPRGALGAFRTNVVYSGPCDDSPTQRIEGGSDALLTWLEENPHLESVNPLPRVVDGITGIQIDVTARERQEPCPDGAGVYLIPLTNPVFSVRLRPGEEFRLVVVDLPGGTVTFDVSAPADSYQDFLADADAVIDTVDFADADG